MNRLIKCPNCKLEFYYEDNIGLTHLICLICKKPFKITRLTLKRICDSIGIKNIEYNSS